MLNLGGNLALIIGGFCLLIALHELGHFLAARWAGIRVHAFAIGMGPVILGYRRGIGVRAGGTDRAVRARFGKPAHRMSDAELREHAISETEYSLRILPIGGFVSMLGQDDLDPSARSDDPRSYQRASIGARMIVVSAGVFANIVLAIALFIVAFMVGVRFEAPVIGALPARSPAAAATPVDAPDTAPGLRPGDRVLEIDGAPMLTFADISIAAAMSRPGDELAMLIERPGRADPLRFRVAPRRDPRGGLRTIAIAPSVNNTITTEPELAAEVTNALDEAELGLSGIGPGWTLVDIDGTPATSGDTLAAAADALGGKPIPTTWRAPDGSRTIEVDVPVSPELPSPRTSEDGTEAEEQPGLLGLMPLAEIAAVEAQGPNDGLLWPGDVILRAGNVIGPSTSELVDAVRRHGPGPFRMHLLRDGAELEVTATIVEADTFGNRQARLGIQLGPAFDVPLLATPVALDDGGDGRAAPSAETRAPDAALADVGHGAAALGILPLSRVDSIDGTPVANWTEMRVALDRALRRAIDDGADTLTVPIVITSPTTAREVRSLELTVTAAQADTILSLGWLPQLSPWVFDPLQVTLSAEGNPIRAVAMGFRQTWRLVQLTYLTLDRLIRGTVGVKELRGPVGIVHIGTRVADRGFMYLLFFLAMISVNLAVINFLPLPIVDGGLFLFLVYEKLRGRPPSVAFQNAATIVGLCFIAGIFLLVSYNDVLRLIGRG